MALTLDQYHRLLGQIVCQLEETRLERDALAANLTALTKPKEPEAPGTLS